MTVLETQGLAAKRAARALAVAGTARKNAALEAAARAIETRQGEILAANAADLEAARAAGLRPALLDRLALDEGRIAGIVEGVRQVAALPDPIGAVTKMDTRPNGLTIGKRRVPLGVIGIILSMMVVRAVLRINLRKEEQDFVSQDDALEHTARSASFVVANPAIFGKSIMELLSSYFTHGDIVISRHYSHETQEITVANGSTILQEHDRVFVIGQPHELDHTEAIFGQRIEIDRKKWIPTGSNLISNKYTITKKTLNGKRLGELQLRQIYGVNVTRVTRAGVDLVAHPGMRLQMGDQIRVVGSDASVNKVRELVGDSQKHLNEPNLIGIFIGIALGVLLGSIPFMFPGIPQPVKLGLAGGPLIVAILLSNFGPKFGIVTYTTQSANLMIREIGIALFLTCVGIGAGDGFVDTIVNGGYHWVGYGFIITIIPMLVVGFLGKKLFKVNYLTLSGVMAGSMTDPPALAYANGLTEEDAPAVGYATVYPLTMFLRVLTAQMLIIFFVS